MYLNKIDLMNAVLASQDDTPYDKERLRELRDKCLANLGVLSDEIDARLAIDEVATIKELARAQFVWDSPESGWLDDEPEDN
jgi:hypothetical protein